MLKVIMPSKVPKKFIPKEKKKKFIRHGNHRDLVVPEKDLPVPEKKRDWRESYHWRIFKIMSEFVDGFQFLADFKKTVTIFGSARCGENDYWYREARRLGAMLAKSGFTVFTGGGPGIMEAANRGAHESGGESVGVNIRLPHDQRINEYVNKSIALHYFFVRRVVLAYSAQAYVFFPGGYGTLDEFFELVTLIQTHKVAEHIPLVLVGKDFWKGLDGYLKDVVLKEYNGIDPQDLQIYTIVNSAEEAAKIVRRAKPRQEF